VLRRMSSDCNMRLAFAQREDKCGDNSAIYEHSADNHVARHRAHPVQMKRPLLRVILEGARIVHGALPKIAHGTDLINALREFFRFHLSNGERPPTLQAIDFAAVALFPERLVDSRFVQRK